MVTAFIERIEDVNGIINCVVDSRFSQALEEARNVDEFISSSSAVDIDELCKFLTHKKNLFSFKQRCIVEIFTLGSTPAPFLALYYYFIYLYKFL